MKWQSFQGLFWYIWDVSLLITLESGIDVHVCLLIFGKFSHLYALIPACTFINFWYFVPYQDQKLESAVVCPLLM